jgi:hypothetical protein
MPNIVFWVNDQIYAEWIDLGREKQKEVKADFRNALIKIVRRPR